MGPVGSGVLWMKPEFVERVWPLVPSPAEIRGMDRYMWSGTYPEPVSSGVLPALELHERLGSARKLARMRFLADHWRSRVERLRGARCYVRAGPEHSCGIVTLELDGVNPEALKDQLWARHRIVVQDMSIPRNPEIRGIRITPNVYTSVAELDRFVAAVEDVRAAY